MSNARTAAEVTEVVIEPTSEVGTRIVLSPTVSKFVLSRADAVLLYGPRREGKLQPIDTPVLTPRGWVKIGDLTVGDDVIAGDGSITHVVGVYPNGVMPFWRLQFSDGTSTLAGDAHFWQVETCWDR